MIELFFDKDCAEWTADHVYNTMFLKKLENYIKDRSRDHRVFLADIKEYLGFNPIMITDEDYSCFWENKSEEDGFILSYYYMPRSDIYHISLYNEQRNKGDSKSMDTAETKYIYVLEKEICDLTEECDPSNIILGYFKTFESASKAAKEQALKDLDALYEDTKKYINENNINWALHMKARTLCYVPNSDESCAYIIRKEELKE